MTVRHFARRARGRVLRLATHLVVFLAAIGLSAWFPWGFALGVPA